MARIASDHPRVPVVDVVEPSRTCSPNSSSKPQAQAVMLSNLQTPVMMVAVTVVTVQGAPQARAIGIEPTGAIVQNAILFPGVAYGPPASQTDLSTAVFNAGHAPNDR